LMEGATPREQMVVLKYRDMVEQYEALIADLKPRRILEIGMYNGGGAALLAQLAEPSKLVVVDIAEGPCRPLERFVDQHDLRGVVVPYYTVDQADTARLTEIVETEFAGEPIDLIIDDASHQLVQTRVSFNCLFPYLRPGGVYVVEDWGWAHNRYPAGDVELQGVPPLSVFVCELVLAAGGRPKIIGGVDVDRHWAAVRRTDAVLRPGVFDIAKPFDKVGREMVDRLEPVRSLRPGGQRDGTAGAGVADAPRG
jgi:hypothetical protein